MKILWLYRYTAHRHYNHWFHTDFANAISEQENVTLKIYGHRMHEQQDINNLLLTPYNNSLSISDLRKEFHFDIIILDCWNRAYMSPLIKQMWLPEDFKQMNIPKIVIEGDYHNIRDKNWYVNLNIDLILHRHFRNVIRAEKDIHIKNIWLPCSIDNNIFKPDLKIERENKLCFIGARNHIAYKYRNRAWNILKKNNLIIRQEVKEEKYITALQTYISHLNGSSIYDLDMAKMFEIMASGSVLFTDKGDISGIHELFPDNAYCTYKRDYSDLLINAKKIINEPDYREYITANAIKCISERHTHQIRAKQLINIIKQEFKI